MQREIETIDVLIVGSGPAGASTALHLVHSDPAWAGRILVIDKAVHPREKLCGGGVTHEAQNILARLGLPLSPAGVPVHEVRLVYQDRSFSFLGARARPHVSGVTRAVTPGPGDRTPAHVLRHALLLLGRHLPAPAGVAYESAWIFSSIAKRH